MSPRTAVKRRRRRRGTSTQTQGVNGGAASLLSQVTALVAQNASLSRENQQLRVSLDTISRAVQGLSSAPVGRRRGRPPKAASVGRPVGRPRRRRRITDPATLERRRAGLAKARQVLAAKRAAAKKGKG